jgi:hypothetical protein
VASRSSVTSVGVTTSAVVEAAPTNYYGYTLYNSGASAAVVTIYDNASAASGTILDVVVVPAAGSVNAYYSVEDSIGGLRAKNGVYFSTTAAVSGSVRVE